jgi:hypothetical protein
LSPETLLCCNPAKERVEFEDGWFVKSSFRSKDEMTRNKILNKNNN